MTGSRISGHPILGDPESADEVSFTFNGRDICSREGEMISSALFANGIHVFGHHVRDGSPQGMFCANGQCAQCLVLADGLPVKACITTVREGMDVRSMEGLPELIADDDLVEPGDVPVVEVDVLIVGGGPAGLSAALELGSKGIDCLVCDDKMELGGKLSLQTHNFFGSTRDCYAGTRGIDIGTDLAHAVECLDTVDLWLDSPVVGAFADGLVGVVREGRYALVRPQRLLVTAGAREKALAFRGCDLPGVYGAGAFQTLVNRDLVKASERLFIVGGGNVGLIAAYHALQAGIEVLGIVEALPECGGYKVHLDKVRRLGVPVFTSHTVLRAEGEEELERVIVCEVDEEFRPVPDTELAFEVDTLLIAVGLSPVSELVQQGERCGLEVHSAGDAEEIAEASAAMFSGRIAGREILADMGFDVEVPPEWRNMLAMLRSKPGETLGQCTVPEGLEVFPVIRCVQEIPCNPCTGACVLQSISIDDATIMGRPRFEGSCLGCASCVSICPGLAITLVDRRYDPSGGSSLVIIPWELPDGTIAPGDRVTTVDMEGGRVGGGEVIAVRAPGWMDRRKLVSVEVPWDDATSVAGIRIVGDVEGAVPEPCDVDDVIVCRCERVKKSEILDYIERTGTRDFNAVKAALRTGMGPCGGKTCHDLVMRIFREVGASPDDVEPHVERPFMQEVPLSAFIGGEHDERA